MKLDNPHIPETRITLGTRPAVHSAYLLALFFLLCLTLLPGAARAATDWSDEVVYFVLIDRFADGDRTNDRGVERRNPGGFHGGDLKGLTGQLDELADLGITALWINPVQKQITQSFYASAPAKLGIPEFRHFGFHGYWIDDFTAMEPHFGSLDDLKKLVEEAHKRHIKVLLDVVYNHAGYGSSYASRRTSDGQGWLRTGEGNCDVDPLTCAVGGLPDFRTELPEVRDYLLNANIGLAKQAGVDGFRLDTFKHIATDFWLEHRRRTREQLGKDFFLLAEYWGGTAGSLDPFFERDEIDAGFDFSFKGSCEAFANGRGRAVAYGSYLGSRHKVRKGYLLAHYLSSHDEPMALYDLNGDKDKFRICAAIQMTSIGMPVIYYGEEVARAGSEWPLNRTDMPWGERDILPGKGLARDEAMRDFYKKLLHIRHRHSALTRGDYTLLTGPKDAVLAFLRQDEQYNDSVMVLVNREDKVSEADFVAPDNWNRQPVMDDLTNIAVTTSAGHIRLTMAPRSVRIFSVSSGKVEH
ncbi:MAG: alpha-glucosidase C-terminal domain-containing protein [Gammaproteobacteria bacterium]|nr:alpha-glucosidase C-terminal domain-containing protein [Gammaproteobacteria bacterium]MBU1482686.1 alpha-glucosidase C-terminal domain-containing protein [Gammaproteobacteria bacterium]